MSSDEGADPKPGRSGALHDFLEDTVGVGAAEYRLTRDLFRRPRSVMDAYDAHGSTAGGLYPRPLRYWLTINGLYLLFSAFTGGMERSMKAGQSVGGSSPDEMYAEMAKLAGKTLEEFYADFEQWMSLFALPIYALCIGGALFLLFRKWSPGDDRQDFRQTFTFLNAWTLWTLPLGLALTLFAPPELMLMISFPLMFLSIPVVYAVFGRGRWWRTPSGAVTKGVVLVLVSMLAFIPYSLLAGALTVLAAMFLP